MKKMKNLYKVHKINLRNVLRTMAFKKWGNQTRFLSKTHLKIVKITWLLWKDFPKTP